MARRRNSYVIRSALEMSNVDTLLPVLKSAIRGRDGEVIAEEVDSVLASVQASISGDSARSYLIARSPAGAALGLMGLQVPPSDVMKPYATTASPGEVINAFVETNLRGRGIGRALLRGIEYMAVSRGLGELVVNSGPRYEDSGWPFWDGMFGEPIAVAADLYGEGIDALVWRKFLES